MKLRKFGAAFLAAAVMMSSAAVVAYADAEETTATDVDAAADINLEDIDLENLDLGDIDLENIDLENIDLGDIDLENIDLGEYGLTDEMIQGINDLTEKINSLTPEEIQALAEEAIANMSEEELEEFLGTIGNLNEQMYDMVKNLSAEELEQMLSMMTDEDVKLFTEWLSANIADEIAAALDQAEVTVVSDKGSPDTGVADVAAVAGIAVVAAGALLLSRKRK